MDPSKTMKPKKFTTVGSRTMGTARRKIARVGLPVV
jgi:hypothetical protein